jgi:hypothetical protein
VRVKKRAPLQAGTRRVELLWQGRTIMLARAEDRVEQPLH